MSSKVKAWSLSLLFVLVAVLAIVKGKTDSFGRVDFLDFDFDIRVVQELPRWLNNI